MADSIRPTQVTVFSALLFGAAIFTLFLGTMASAYYLMSISLFISTYCLWTRWKPSVFKGFLLLNQLTAIILIVLIAYRKIALPMEDVTLSISGLALIGNVLVGGPFLGILSIPLLTLLSRGKTLPAWLASRS